MAEHGNSAHFYRLGDGGFRLTFASKSPSGASFSNEIGDLSLSEIEDWLEYRVNPATDIDALLRSIEEQTESTVPVGRTLMNIHFDDEVCGMVKSPATIEDVCQWLSEYQQQYFDDAKITIVAEAVEQKKLKGTACFSSTMADGGCIIVSSELMQFTNALRISLLHELIHANLHATGERDPADDHGGAFKSEVKRLMNAGAYDPLL